MTAATTTVTTASDTRDATPSRRRAPATRTASRGSTPRGSTPRGSTPRDSAPPHRADRATADRESTGREAADRETAGRAVPEPEPTEPPTEDLTPGERLRQSAERLLVAGIDLAAGKAVELVDGLADRLEDVAGDALGAVGDPSSVGMGAALGAGKAMMAGGNPVWGAIKGGWGALSTGKKVAIVLVLVLLGLLSPVTLVLALVALLVVAIVRAAKS